MADIFDTVAADSTNAAPKAASSVGTPSVAGTPPQSQYAPGRPSGDIFDHVAAGAYDQRPSTEDGQNRGFLETAGSDLYELGKGAVELPGKTVAYAIAGQPHDDVARSLEQQQEAHKKQVYSQFASDFHAGNYTKAFSGLLDLFDPKYGDPNDPLNQAMSAQWQSSGLAKQRMLEAAKRGDTAAVIQHAAGVIPIASQVDAAMENYHKQPTRENLAHIVTSAIPAFIPSASRLAARGAGAVSEALTNQLRPVAEEVAGEQIPVRNPSPLATQATKALSADIPRQFAIEETGPAAARAVQRVAKAAANTDVEVGPTETDRFGIKAVADQLSAKSRDVFQKLDELSENKLSEAQQRAADYSDDYSGEGRKAYREALADQDAVFDQFKEHPEMQGKDLGEAKADWRKANALRDISKKLTAATERSEVDGLDYQVKQGRQLADSIDNLIKNGRDVLGRAGFSADHIDSLQQLGKIVEDQANIPRFNSLLGFIGRNLVGKGLAGMLGYSHGGLLGAASGVAAESIAESLAQKAANRWLGPILTDASSLDALNKGLTSSAPIATVSNPIIKRLSALWKDETGSLGAPGTVSTDTESGQLAPTFFSKAEQVANQKVSTGSGDSILAALRNNGVKESEIGWLGLDDYLKGKQKVSKADLLQYINEHKIALNEVNLGGNDWKNVRDLTVQRNKVYAENNNIWADHLRYADGATDLFNAMKEGKDIEPVISKMPESLQDPARRFVETDQQIRDLDSQITDAEKAVKPSKYESYTLPGDKDNYTEKLLTLPYEKKGLVLRDGETAIDALNRARAENPPPFRSSHFDEPNVLAHTRYDDRTSLDGKKTLFLEELQSDWHQKGKREGYRDKAPEPITLASIEHGGGVHSVRFSDGSRSYVGYGTVGSNATDAEIRDYFKNILADKNSEVNAKYQRGVPDAPFKSDWHELAMKRMLRHAAENGYDRLAWTTGDQQAARYDLSRKISKLEWHPVIGSGDGRLWAFDHSGNAVMQEQIHPSQIADYIGKDAAQKLLDAPVEYSETGRRQWKSLAGVDLKVGGEWAKALYDRAIPNFLNKYAKKWGARVGTSDIVIGTDTDRVFVGTEPSQTDIREVWRTSAGTLHTAVNNVISAMQDGKSFAEAMDSYGTEQLAEKLGGKMQYGKPRTEKVHSIDITPAMKKSVLQEGQPIARATPPDTGLRTVLEGARSVLAGDSGLG